MYRIHASYVVISLAIAASLAWPLSAVGQTTSGSQSSGIGPAGQDALDFLGETAKRGGLTENPNATTDPADIIAMILNTILGLVGIIFFIQLFYAGFRWMTSGGSEEVVTEAKKTIRTAIIGIIVIFSAFVITNFVLNRLESINKQPTSPSATDATTPTSSEAPLGTCLIKVASMRAGETCDNTVGLITTNITESTCYAGYEQFASDPQSIGCEVRWTPN